MHMKSSRFPEASGSKALPPPMRYRSPSPTYRKVPEKRYMEKVSLFAKSITFTQLLHILIT